MLKRCPFCHNELDIPKVVGQGGYCKCGAYAEINLLTNAGAFREKAKKALGVTPVKGGPGMEVVDGGTVFEENGEPVIIQWAQKPS